jgi:hypothetical protein
MQHSKLKSPEDYLAEFLSELFRVFKSEGLDYAVARDYESLPRGLNGRDLDILIQESEFARAYGLLLGTARTHAAHVFKIDQEADTYAWAFVVHWDEPSWGIHIDFLRPRCSNWRGCCFIDETAALRRKVLSSGIYALRNEDVIFMQFCRDIVGNLCLREKYRKPVIRLYLENAFKFQNELEKIFGRRLALELVEICRRESFDHLAALGKRLRRGIITRNLGRMPLKTIKEMLRYVACRCREYLRPNGIMVSVLEGDLPATLAEQIKGEIYRLTRSHARVYDGRSLRGTVNNPPKALLSWELSDSLLRLWVLGRDAAYHTVRYWFWIRPYLGRKCIVAICDGYFYDHFSHPLMKRGFLKEAGLVFGLFVPRPDLLILSEETNAAVTRSAGFAGAQVRISKRAIDRAAARDCPPGPLQDDGVATQHAVRAVLCALSERLGRVDC